MCFQKNHIKLKELSLSFPLLSTIVANFYYSNIVRKKNNKKEQYFDKSFLRWRYTSEKQDRKIFQQIEIALLVSLSHPLCYSLFYTICDAFYHHAACTK